MKVDMSSEAINDRLRRGAKLWRLAMSLRQAGEDAGLQKGLQLTEHELQIKQAIENHQKKLRRLKFIIKIIIALIIVAALIIILATLL